MKRLPFILVSADVAAKGVEFADRSVSLSENYTRALLDAGAIPLAMPPTTLRPILAQAVARCDGVLLTGGEDVNPDFYEPRMPARLRKRVKLTPDHGARDLRELVLVEEVFKQRKPLLAICRGHQVLNVALGGTLIADIPSQLPRAMNHRQVDRKCEKVHDAHLTPESLLAKITGRRTLGVNSTHHQAVARPAGVLEISAQSADGVVEGLELKPAAAHLLPFLLSVQFHPERLAGRYAEHRKIFHAFAKACRAKS